MTITPTHEPISELESRLAAAVDPIQRIDALAALGWALRQEDMARAHALASEARELAIVHGHKLGQARAARTMAMTLRGTEATLTVFRMADEAKRLFDEVGDDYGRAASRDYLASIYEHIGELTLALELALDALSIARRLGDPIRQGHALSSVGGILASSGELVAGIERLEEALQIFESAGDMGGVVGICTRLAKALKAAGRKAEALRYAKRCVDFGAKGHSDWTYSAGYTVMAEVEDELGNQGEAERLYREALTAITTGTICAGIQVALGRLLMRRGALADASVELTGALARISGDAVSIVTESAARDALAELLEKQGDPTAAIDELRKAQAMKEQISQRNAKSRVAQVEARAAVDAARKDAEIHKLRFVELHAMQSKLVEAEKMAILGTIAAGTAHELNTPLGVLSSNANVSATAVERLVALVGRDEEARGKAAKLAAVLETCKRSTDQAVERLSAVALSFKRFTQLDQADLKAFDVREGLESALALLAPTISREIELTRRFDEVPKIQGWPRELNQAFMTVLQNAVESIDGAGVVTAETGATPDHVIVRVRDNGRGMSAEKAAHLFDMAWSEEGSRTKMRMGLSAALATTRRHGGDLTVSSTPGAGTTVTFTFPLGSAARSSEG